MGTDVLLTVIGVLGVGVAALSAKMRRLPISEPLLGLAGGVLIGPQVLDVVHEISRILLAVSVMAVALRYPITDIRPMWRPVTVLLVVAMPVMAVVTGTLGWLLLSIPVAAAKVRAASPFTAAPTTR